MKLRSYQQQIINKMIWAKDLPGNDLISAPQASGKSIIIANFAKQIGEPVLILQPNRELLEQNLDKLLNYVDRSRIGVYSASMGEKTLGEFTFATIGSIYKRPEDFKHFRYVLLDESSLLNPKSLDTMYMKFVRVVKPKVFGLTATPFRMDHNYLNGGRWKYDIETIHVTKLLNRMKGRFWSRMLHVVHIEDLLKEGYLCPLEYQDMTLIDPDELPVNKSRSDYDLEAYEELISPKEKQVVQSLHNIAAQHHSIIVFCPTIPSTNRFQRLFPHSVAVSSQMDKKARNEAISGFRSGKYKIVFNVNILSYGFDHPQIDAVVLLRPTRSMAWYMQAVGRGMRINPGKEKCVVYDFTGTHKVLGRAETMKIVRLEDGWNIQTETGLFHNKELYRYKLNNTKIAGLPSFKTDIVGQDNDLVPRWNTNRWVSRITYKEVRK